jgi:hypothetical protein
MSLLMFGVLALGCRRDEAPPPQDGSGNIDLARRHLRSRGLIGPPRPLARAKRLAADALRKTVALHLRRALPEELPASARKPGTNAFVGDAIARVDLAQAAFHFLVQCG